ncbi:MAG: pilin [Candidatus Saccharimonadales bacterium]
MKYIKIVVVVLSSVLIFTTTSTAADATNTHTPTRLNLFSSSLVGDACSGLSQAAVAGNGCQQGGNTIQSIAHTAVTIMSLVVGAISIIMIMVAGLKFVTSGGDSNGVASARKTLIYAVIGIFVAVLAQLLVHYVLSTSNKIQNSSYLNKSTVINRDA